MADPRTIAIYDARAADYAALTDSDAPDADLRAFIDMIPAGGHVLDLGCGPAFASRHMLAAGLRPDPVDASAAMVAAANRTPGLTARQATFDDISGVAIYDGIWANFSLLHAPRADLPRHIAACATALVAGGAFHIGMKTGQGEDRDAIDRLYTYVETPELAAMLTANGLLILDTRHGRDTGLSGSIDPWVIMRAKKNG